MMALMAKLVATNALNILLCPTDYMHDLFYLVLQTQQWYVLYQTKK